MELWLFKNLTYFLISWPSYGTFERENYRVLCCGRLHMWTKFGDDWSETATGITENVAISYKHEYRRHTLTSRCDVISDVNNIKNTFYVIICDVLSISAVKINLSQIFRNFKMATISRFELVFKPEVVPEVESYTKIGHTIPCILRFCSTF